MIPVAMEMALHDLAIRQLLARLAQAADDRDEATYLACLAGTVRPAPSGGAAPVPAETYMRAAMARLSRADWTQHKLVNPVIDIQPDRIRASARVDAVVDLALTDPDGKQHRLTIGGRYEIGLTQQGGTWLIDRRWLHRLYVDGDAKGLAI
ncbi:nuclear transport factor 2 family protein [Bosea sp. TND4EK4]|uniref:nuclear transport factor 2 family protein n=1 Tax=Bosea sp. TND4EK4 TaxID=1907408 RepID=UPI000957156D|nr:nuclear transport factor 2 family protein [Bosea sp. TND4EK4]SIQ24669.1 SnoaL-like domain-containing protein [Bosea sp. TND4EK4]